MATRLKTALLKDKDNAVVYPKTTANEVIIDYGDSTTLKERLNISAGSPNQPVYFDGTGKPIAIMYSIQKNVPSTAAFTDTTHVVAANGLTGGGSKTSSDGVTLNVGQGAGIIVEANAVKVALTSDTKLAYDATTVHTPTSTTVQPVRLDASGKLAVVMPNMTAATASAAGSKGLVPAPAAGKQASFLRGDGTWATPTDTNTHYTTKLFATSSSGTAHAATTNGGTYLRLFDDSTARQSIKIVGSGATTVTSDANGVITINSTDNNTTNVTAGSGLTGGGSSGSVTLNVGAGNGIKVDENTVSVNTDYTTSGKNYKVAVDSTTGGLYVNVPWTDTDTNTTKVTAGDGLTGGGSAASGTGVTLNVGAGVGITVAADAVKAKLRSETALTVDSAAATTTSGRVYPVAIDKTGYLAVNVPWTSIALTQGTGTTVTYTGLGSAQTATINIANSGVTAGSYGPSANVSATHSGTFSVPYITVDKTGRITSASTQTITLPASGNTDTKVKQTATTSSTKYPVLMSAQSSPTSGTAYEAKYNTSVTIGSSVLYGAAWNDYAEYRETKETIEPGRVICENGDDTLSLAVERLQPGASVVSDTFGFTIGETEKAKTPIAVSGRVLVYPYEDRNSYKPGDAVCAAPNGTVSKMTREEIREYPERIVGTVSAIPEYETWGEDNVPVNGRIWIKVK